MNIKQLTGQLFARKALGLIAAMGMFSSSIADAATMFVANYGDTLGSGSVGTYDSVTGAAINASFITGLNDPGAVQAGNGAVYVLSYNDNKISSYNATTGATLNASLVSGLDSPFDMAISGNDLYVLENGNSELRIGRYNATTGAALSSSLITGISAETYVITVAGGKVYAADNLAGTVKIFNATTGALMNTANVGGTPFDIDVDSGKLYVLDDVSKAISVYNADTGALETSNLITSMGDPYDFTVSSGLLYLTDYNGGTVAIYNAVTGALQPGSVSGLTAPVGVAIPVPFTVSVSAPAENAVVAQAVSVTVSGTADLVVSHVSISVNNGSAINATLSTGVGVKNWTVSVPHASLVPGNNTVVATGTDGSGNTASSPTRTFFYAAASPITVTYIPSNGGTVSFSPALLGTPGNYQGIVGTNYTITARPALGYYFSAWGGTPTGSSVTTSFTFAVGGSVTATFLPTPFNSTTAGTYAGVGRGVGASDVQQNAGFFSFTVVQNTGVFTGKAFLDGQTVPMAGILSNVGLNFTSSTVSDGFIYNLTIDNSGPVAKLNGTITRRRAGSNVSVITVATTRCYGKGNPPPGALVVPYNAAFGVPVPSGSLVAGDYPTGNGYGILTIGAADGAVKLAGFMADGTPYASKTFLCMDNTIPIYASFAARVGCVVGTATMANLAGSDFEGTNLRWHRAENGGHYYPWGYDTGLTVTIVGAKQSTSTKSSLGLSAAPTIDLSGGDLTTPVTKTIPLSGTAHASADKTTKVAFSSVGVVAGAFEPVKGAKRVIKGIIVGKAGSGEVYGYFQSPLPKQMDGSGLAGQIVINP
ncbi:MAG: hypothetical protein JNJ83_23580 [Verrucomicrobiaceae bacterium]|nr:hypothetical protein [Verrucomicrobiaceae bacterium]